MQTKMKEQQQTLYTMLIRRKGNVWRSIKHDILQLDIEFSFSNSGAKFNSYADLTIEHIEKDIEASGIEGKQAFLPKINYNIP